MGKKETEKRILAINTTGAIVPIIPFLTEKEFLLLKKKQIPIVFLNAKFPSVSPYLVTSDLKQCVRKITRSVLKSGKRKIGIFESLWESSIEVIREGVEEAFSSEGLYLETSIIKKVAPTYEDGKRTMERLLSGKTIPEIMIADDDYVIDFCISNVV